MIGKDEEEKKQEGAMSQQNRKESNNLAGSDVYDVTEINYNQEPSERNLDELNPPSNALTVVVPPAKQKNSVNKVRERRLVSPTASFGSPTSIR